MKSLTEKLRDEAHGDPVLALITLFLWTLVALLVGSIVVLALVVFVVLLVTQTIWLLGSVALLGVLGHAVWRLIVRATS